MRDLVMESYQDKTCSWSIKSRTSKNKVTSSKDGSPFARNTNRTLRVQISFSARFCVSNYL